MQDSACGRLMSNSAASLKIGLPDAQSVRSAMTPPDRSFPLAILVAAAASRRGADTLPAAPLPADDKHQGYVLPVGTSSVRDVREPSRQFPTGNEITSSGSGIGALHPPRPRSTRSALRPVLSR